MLSSWCSRSAASATAELSSRSSAAAETAEAKEVEEREPGRVGHEAHPGAVVDHDDALVTGRDVNLIGRRYGGGGRTSGRHQLRPESSLRYQSSWPLCLDVANTIITAIPICPLSETTHFCRLGLPIRLVSYRTTARKMIMVDNPAHELNGGPSNCELIYFSVSRYPSAACRVDTAASRPKSWPVRRLTPPSC